MKLRDFFFFFFHFSFYFNLFNEYDDDQGIGFVTPMEAGSNPTLERRPKPQRERVLNCPRCNSTDTKFCYYNNYSFSQPRHFCKTCRRYWTAGGSLRNVPVGGGSRKNKRSSSSSGLSMNLTDLNTPCFPDQSAVSSDHNPNSTIHHEYHRDLKLAYPPNYTESKISSSSSASSSEFNSFMGMPAAASNSNANATCQSGNILLQEPKKTLDFSSSDGFENNGARLWFPLQDIKPEISNTTTDRFELNRGQAQAESTGYWTRLLGGGSW